MRWLTSIVKVDPAKVEADRNRRRVDKKKVYNSDTWKRLRVAFLSTHPACACGCGRPAEDVDHVKALEEGGEPFDENNLQALSHACHSRKTQKEITRSKR